MRSINSNFLPSRTAQLSPLSQLEPSNDTRPSLDISISAVPPSTSDLSVSHWFASTETWKVDFPAASPDPVSTDDVKRFIRSMHRWLGEWAQKGSNPFIHARLYRTRFPRCVQSAFAVLTCYVHRTPANEALVFRIIEENAKELVAGYEIPAQKERALDPLESLARVHALLVYQTIGLFDGDIRLRYLAESYIPILNAWLRSMVSSSSEAETCLGGSVVVGAADQTAHGINSAAK